MTYDNCFSGGVGLLGAFLSWYLGELDGAVKLLIVMAIIDQISGLLKFQGYSRQLFSKGGQVK